MQEDLMRAPPDAEKYVNGSPKPSDKLMDALKLRLSPRRLQAAKDVVTRLDAMDGFNPTNLDKDVVASTILGALYDEKRKEFHDVDVIFPHLTSTKDGDLAEIEVFRMVFGNEYLRKIPIAAIKSNLGHLAGGSGPVNMIAAINAINTGRIPHVINLDNPDPAVADLNLVRGKPLEANINTALVTAYGFGGYNAVLLLGKYKV